MRIAIVGAGAIGCLFGIRLHVSGENVLLIHHNSRTVAAIRNNGVQLRELTGKTLRAHIPIEQSLSKSDRPDLVLLTVKAYDTETAARGLSGKLGLNVPILSLQNGLGNIEGLSRHFSKSLILGGTTTEAVLLTGPGVVVHRGRGITYLGGLSLTTARHSSKIAMVFRSAGFRTRISRNIAGVIWSKAIVNSAINPISALARVSNRDIGRIASLRQVALALVREGTTIARAYRVTLSPSPRTFLFKVLAGSGQNRSSMLQDIESGRKTEIRQLNGEIASVGEKVGAPSSLNRLIADLIMGLEASRN